jgi:hypothetical protein
MATEESSPPMQEEPPIPESSPTPISYSLRFVGGPSTSQLVAVAVATAVYTALTWISSSLLSSGVPVVSFLFVAIGFGVPFALWFGGWSFVIGYIGSFVGAGLLTGMPLTVALMFGVVDIIQLGLPMILYRTLGSRLGVSPTGKDVGTVRGFVFFLCCAVLINNILGALYGNFILVQFGIAPENSFWFAVITWALSNFVLTTIIGTLLLRTVGPVVERSGLTVHNAIS